MRAVAFYTFWYGTTERNLNGQPSPELLETVEVPLRSAVQEAVAIIDPSADNGTCHLFYVYDC